MRQLLFWALFLCPASLCLAQPTAGTEGLLNTPSARMPGDGTFSAGASYLPDVVTPQPQFSYNTFNYYIAFTFLPFVELSYRMVILRDDGNELLKNQDRSVALRVRLLREGKWLPALVAGGNDIYTTSGSGNQYFRSFYLAATKTLNCGKSLAGITLGYNYVHQSHDDELPVFGGLSFSPGFMRSVTFIGEYDSHNVNAGATVLIFKHVFLYFYAAGMSQPAGGISFRLCAHGGGRNFSVLHGEE